MGIASFKNQTTPTTPESGRTEVYVNSVTKKLNSVDDLGIVTDYSATVNRIETFTTITDTTVLNDSHNIIYCNKATTFTVTLPAVATCSGRIYTIKNINSGIVVIDGNASETIDGELTVSLLTKYKSVTIQSTGTAWFII